MYGYHCHVADAPNPWRRTSGLRGGLAGTHMWTLVTGSAASGRWTATGRRPAARKRQLKQRSRAAAKLRKQAALPAMDGGGGGIAALLLAIAGAGVLRRSPAAAEDSGGGERLAVGGLRSRRQRRDAWLILGVLLSFGFWFAWRWCGAAVKRNKTEFLSANERAR